MDSDWNAIPLGAGTSVGLTTGVSVPSGCSTLYPQQYALPTVVSAHVCDAATTALIDGRTVSTPRPPTSVIMESHAWIEAATTTAPRMLIDFEMNERNESASVSMECVRVPHKLETRGSRLAGQSVTMRRPRELRAGRVWLV